MTMTGRIILLAAFLTGTAAAQGPTAGQGGPNWSMIVVQRKPDFCLWDADRKVEPGEIGLVYHVDKIERSHVLLTVPGRGVRGWTPSNAVISLAVAEDYFTQGTLINPDDPFAYMMRGIVRAERGNAKGAMADLDEAVRRGPGYVPALVRRAAMLRARDQPARARAPFYLARGDAERALFDLDEVIRLSPGSALAHNERAWLLTTCRDEKLRDAGEAVKSATRACELTGWKNPRYLATLAAANSETGDFAAAVHNQKRAVALLGDGSPEEAEYRRLLYRYRMKRPHHALGLIQEMVISSVPAAEKEDE